MRACVPSCDHVKSLTYKEQAQQKAILSGWMSALQDLHGSHTHTHTHTHTHIYIFLISKKTLHLCNTGSPGPKSIWPLHNAGANFSQRFSSQTLKAFCYCTCKLCNIKR